MNCLVGELYHNKPFFKKRRVMDFQILEQNGLLHLIEKIMFPQAQTADQGKCSRPISTTWGVCLSALSYLVFSSWVEKYY